MTNKLIYIILIVILILIILFLSFGKEITKPSYININDKEAKVLVNDGALIIDVRASDEYNTKHIKGSINIPYNKISSLDASKDTEIIIYCNSEAKAKKTAEKLINLGYTKVYILKTS